MKSVYVTRAALVAVSVLGATGAMAATNAAPTTLSKAPTAQVRQVSTEAAKPATTGPVIQYQNSTVGTLPATGEVRLHGAVSDITPNSFMLKDTSGTIKIDQPASSRLSLKDNAEVTVYGRVTGAGDTKTVAANRIVEAAMPRPLTAPMTTTR